MNIVDATDRTQASDAPAPPSLLTIILDTNPHAWSLLASDADCPLPLSIAVATLLVYINAHLSINHANQVAVIASHSDRAEWLYPTPATSKANESSSNGAGNSEDVEMAEAGGPVQPPADDANKYRPFAHVEHTLLSNLRALVASTSAATLENTPSTMLSGALTRALAYISKQTATPSGAGGSSQSFNYSDPSSVAGGNDASLVNSSTASGALTQTISPRILLVSVSGDLASQYIPLMNAIFCCQRQNIPIDILKLAGDAVFLQQAADATGGIYMPLTSSPSQRAGLLQVLMMAYLPDISARRHLISPTATTSAAGGSGGAVDFRAACFCHRRIVDLGYVCSICLSIFCGPHLDEGGGVLLVAASCS